MCARTDASEIPASEAEGPDFLEPKNGAQAVVRTIRTKAEVRFTSLILSDIFEVL